MTQSSNMLGRYQIIREIARSNDIVYEAVDPSIGRRIALKELQMPPNLVGSAKRERVERFYREAKAAGALSHPNIVTVFEVGEEAGRHFIAMEFLEGQNLQEMIEIRGAVPPKEAAGIVVQVLDALQYAHSKGIIHRDIKPANIQILPGGIVKLTDFGIARITHEPSITASGQIFGTPSYMSPEQVAGRDIDPRSDLFSAGVVLYEALTGSKPFTGDSVVTITYNIMNTPSVRPGGVPEGLADIVERSVSKAPEGRFQSASEFADALRGDWEAVAPVLIGSAPPPIFFPPGPGGGLGQPPQQSQPPGTSQPYGAPQPMPQPNLPPPFPGPVAAPRGPFLSPGQRSAIVTVLLSVILGGALLLAIWGVGRAWENIQLRQNDEQAIELVQRGDERFNAGDYTQAAEHYAAAAAKDLSPETRKTVADRLVEAYVGQAQAHLNAGSLARAAQSLQRALQANPDSGNALYLLGITNARGGNWTEAVRLWEQAATRDPQSDGGRMAVDNLQQYYYRLALEADAAGDRSRTIRLLRKIVEIDAGTPLAMRAQIDIDRALFR